MFMKLLNDLSLVGKKYDAEDSNIKFLMALSEKWDLKTTTIRDNYELDPMSLDEIYGLLKTHEFEMEHRRNIKNAKEKIVAFRTEEEPSKARLLARVIQKKWPCMLNLRVSHQILMMTQTLMMKTLMKIL